MPPLERWQQQIRAIRDTWGTLEWWDAPAGTDREDLMVGSDLTFVERGLHELKGVPGTWGLYAASKDAGDSGGGG